MAHDPSQLCVPLNSSSPGAPAGRIAKLFPADELSAQSARAVSVARDLARRHPEYGDWLVVPILNRTGACDDSTINTDGRSVRFTELALSFPCAIAVARHLELYGYQAHNIRLAVLVPGGILRCHTDMHSSMRLLLPLNESARNFRHLFENVCVSTKPGELWAVDGKRVHGAANLSRTDFRALLIIDGVSSDTSPILPTPWDIPTECIVRRHDWNPALRESLGHELGNISEVSELERQVLKLPFEYELSATGGYDFLIELFRQKARAAHPAELAHFWSERADYWTLHNCVCVSAVSG
jgi:hypothetical protein